MSYSGVKSLLYTLVFFIFSTKPLLAQSACETLRSLALIEVQQSHISNCQLEAKLAKNGDDLSLSHQLAFEYLEFLDNYQTNTKLSSGLLDESSLNSFSLKYQIALNELSPYAENENAMALVYQIYSGKSHRSGLSLLNIYKGKRESETIPVFEPFDDILDKEKAFYFLAKLQRINPEKYTVLLGEAYFDGDGTETSYSKGLELIHEAFIANRSVDAATSLSMKLISLGASLKRDLFFLSVSRGVLQYSYYLQAQNKSGLPSLIDFEKAFNLATMFRGYQKEDITPEVKSAATVLYGQLLTDDFSTLSKFVKTTIDNLRHSGL
ncbi:MAG: hypothetical protein GJ680_18495 [Alteromonadaceae bacterium]|nr:hypothetical protein [Alteromonadaceae bacterium]